MKTILLLYGTSCCHLCEQAHGMLSDVYSANEITVREVDIADDETLLDRYGIRIPVLAMEGTNAELDWPFDHEDVIAWMHSVANLSRQP